MIPTVINVNSYNNPNEDVSIVVKHSINDLK